MGVLFGDTNENPTSCACAMGNCPLCEVWSAALISQTCRALWDLATVASAHSSRVPVPALSHRPP